MSVVWVCVLFVLGLALIVKGGDAFVDAAGWMARVSGIPPFLIGATVVSLATTLPELLVSVFAAGEGKAGMAVGSAIGSVTANLGLIMGVSAVSLPAVIRRGSLLVKGLLMIAACGLLLFLSRDGVFTVAEGAALLALFALGVWESVRDARAAGGGGRRGDAGTAERAAAGSAAADGVPAPVSPSSAPRARPRVPRREILINLLKFLFGAAGIVLGAQLLVDNGGALARLLGVPEEVVAATLIAIGTSLPELVTTLTAIRKQQSALSVGNIVGANLIDLTLILPLCAFRAGGALPVAAQSASLDLPFCLSLCLLGVIPTLAGGRFRRAQGASMLAVYAGYLALLLR